MTLVAIILATLAAGIGSVWVAALLMSLGGGRTPGVMPQRLLSLAAGALLATAFMHLLPEAFESHGKAHDLFVVLLVGLLGLLYRNYRLRIRMDTTTDMWMRMSRAIIRMITTSLMVTRIPRAAGPF